MKFSFSTLGCPDYTFEQIIALACSSGYTGIEFRVYRGEENLQNLEEFQRPNLLHTRRLFQNAGLSICCLSSGVRFSFPDPQDAALQLQNAQAFLQLASDLECPYIRVFGGPYPVNFTNRSQVEPFIQAYWDSLPAEKVAGLTQQQCDQFLMECLGKVGEMGRKYGVMPLMETHDDFCNGAVVKKLIDGCGSDNVGILWDCLHPYRYGMDLEETYREVRDKIHHVHMKDAANLTPWGFKPVLVGQGQMDVQKAVQILEQNHYADFVSFEWEKQWYPDIPDASVACPQFLEAVSAMLP
ncbi:MAG: sugar phosphate isomerase/epimerase family protein [Candidatus Merdivicinus sp.]|jgi:sugar phosphate isomerase/epimerase